MASFKILFFGDVIGAIGRAGIVSALPDLRATHSPDLVIVNVENLAHGRGISAKGLLELDAVGVDAYTSGNHVWQNEQGISCFEDARWKNRLVRPSNILSGRPGVGSIVIEKNGVRVLITNILGRLFMKDEVESPFTALDTLLAASPHAHLQILDLHAETTSEKEAVGHYIDGRVTAVFGTHTHVPTADQKILSGGTAYVTDVGRNGAHDSVVGFEKKSSIERFLHPEERNYEIPKTGKIEINAILVEADTETGLATKIERIRQILDK